MTRLTIFFISLILLNLFHWGKARCQNLPDLGTPTLATLTPQQEQKLGHMFMQAVRQQATIINDPISNDYLNSLGSLLTAAVKHYNTRFHFFIVKDPSINAFSGPAGYIGMNTGLIFLTKSESELAAVLSHEIAHTTQHHIALAFKQAKMARLPTLAALLAAILVGGKGNPAAGAATATAVMASQGQHMINFTRSKEKEADRIGMRILHRAGFNPRAIVKMFQRMRTTNASYDNIIPAYLQNHPLVNERIADAENRIALYPHKRRKSRLEYFLFKTRLKALLTTNKQKILTYFRTKPQNEINLYGYSIALISNRQFTKADKTIKKLVEINQDQPLYQMLLAKLKTKENKPSIALKILKKSLTLYPDYYPLILQYSETLIAGKKFREARYFLRRTIITFQNDIALYALLSKAQKHAGHLAEAYQSRAKIFELIGDRKLALLLLQQALRLPKLSSDNREILKARITSLSRSRG